MTLESSDTSNDKPAVSRRTVVRGTAAAAATVWTASAVTMVTATPAHAASADLKLALETARYVNNTTLLQGLVDPTRLELQGTYGNTGPQTTQNFQITLSIPANLYATAPTATTPTGFGAPSISGSLAAGWTLVYTRTSQIAVGVTGQPFKTTITFTDPAASFDDAPFRRWAGSQFTLSATANATNGTPASAAPTIAATPNVNIKVTSPNARWRNASTGASGRHVQYLASKVHNEGRSSIGKMKLELRLTKSTSSASYLHDAPNTAAEIR
ncbi:MAG: hypothetical protein GX678_08645, partial [Actinomycetales bacterium]|nr:hypothetical protein [Actinomycetales bacterium]